MPDYRPTALPRSPTREDTARPLLPQAGLLGGTFLLLALLSAALYAILAGELRRAVTNPVVSKTMNRVGASALVGAGHRDLEAGFLKRRPRQHPAT